MSTAPARISQLGLTKNSTSFQRHHISGVLQPRQFIFIYHRKEEGLAVRKHFKLRCFHLKLPHMAMGKNLFLLKLSTPPVCCIILNVIKVRGTPGTFVRIYIKSIN